MCWHELEERREEGQGRYSQGRAGMQLQDSDMVLVVASNVSWTFKRSRSF